MSDLKMQEEFDEAFRKQFGFGRMTASANADAGQMLKAAEWAWQASRECLVIELPEQGPSFTVDGVTSFSLKNEGRNEAIKEIEVSIHAVGVKTK